MSYRYVNRVPRPWTLLYPAVLLFWIILLAVVGATADLLLWSIPSMLVALVAIRAFMTLTISVANGEVVTVFHWGWPRRRISLADVTSQRVTTHGARYGWAFASSPAARCGGSGAGTPSNSPWPTRGARSQSARPTPRGSWLPSPPPPGRAHRRAGRRDH